MASASGKRQGALHILSTMDRDEISCAQWFVVSTSPSCLSLENELGIEIGVVVPCLPDVS